MSRQSSILARVQLDPCCEINPTGSIGIMSQHSKIVSRQRILLGPIFLLFLLELSLVHLKPTKQEVGEYSIIQHKNES